MRGVWSWRKEMCWECHGYIHNMYLGSFKTDSSRSYVPRRFEMRGYQGYDVSFDIADHCLRQMALLR